MEPVRIGKRLVGKNEPPYVIAEIGANHNGEMDLCKRMIDAAVKCQADAVKFQSWSTTSLISKAEYDRNVNYDDKHRHFGSLREMVERYQFTPDQHREIANYCHAHEIEFLSSCFSPGEVDLLESFEIAAFKIASMDINHHVLLERVARTGKPVILSTGMATLDEISKAIDILKDSGAAKIILLHCISIYPPEFENIHLRNILMLQQTFNIQVGFSDHTLGTAISLAAIALGATVIEKHFTLDKNMEGWDHWISAEPAELQALVIQGRNVQSALGSTVRTVSEAEMLKRKAFRRRIVVKRSIKRGEKLKIEDVDFKRPGTGINPDEIKYILGRTLAKDVEEEHELEWADLI
jgi:N-acetylneuraminate synthase